MNEISCPHCGKAFKIDEAGYADILKQVRDHAFEEQLKERLSLADKDKANELALREEKLNRQFESKAQEKDAKIQELKSQLESGKTQLERAVLSWTSSSPAPSHTSPPPLAWTSTVAFPFSNPA